MKHLGKKLWLIPDCYTPSKSEGMESHESVCVLNTGDTDAELTFTLYFEDNEPLTASETCPARRTRHIRMSRLKLSSGKPLPLDTSYAVSVQSTCPVSVQYSRMDTSLGGMALMTTVAHPVE